MERGPSENEPFGEFQQAFGAEPWFVSFKNGTTTTTTKTKTMKKHKKTNGMDMVVGEFNF